MKSARVAKFGHAEDCRSSIHRFKSDSWLLEVENKKVIKMSDKEEKRCVGCFSGDKTVEQMRDCCAERQRKLGVDEDKPASC